MKKEEFIQDIICQVLVGSKSRELIYSVLNEFIPGYEKIGLDYANNPHNESFKFQSKDEMINCYINALNVSQTFYWNKYIENPDKIMVGVNITNDNQIVFSLTFNGTLKTEAEYYLRFKKFLNSDIGIISYINPAVYDNGQDFETKYGSIKYDFE